jgi:hypothetical protein
MLTPSRLQSQKGKDKKGKRGSSKQDKVGGGSGSGSGSAATDSATELALETALVCGVRGVLGGCGVCLPPPADKTVTGWCAWSWWMVAAVKYCLTVLEAWWRRMMRPCQHVRPPRAHLS